MAEPDFAHDQLIEQKLAGPIGRYGAQPFQGRHRLIVDETLLAVAIDLGRRRIDQRHLMGGTPIPQGERQPDVGSED